MISQTQFQGQLFAGDQYTVSPENAHVLGMRSAAFDGFSADVQEQRRAFGMPIKNEAGAFIGHMGPPASTVEMRTRKYFHGSTADIPVGGYVEPGAKHGKDNYGYDRNESVFMAPSLAKAATWGRRTRYGTLHPSDTSYAYEVEPEGINEKHGRMVAEFQADRARVVKKYAVTGHKLDPKITPMHEPKPSDPQPKLFD